MIFASEILNKTKYTFKHLLFRSISCSIEYVPDYMKQEALRDLTGEFIQHIIENKSEYISYPLIDDSTDVKVLSLSAYVVSERDFANIIEDIYYRIYSQAYRDGEVKGIEKINNTPTLTPEEIKRLIRTLDPDLYDQVDINKHIKQIVKDRKYE